MKNKYPIWIAILDTTMFKVAILIVLFGAGYMTLQTAQTMRYFPALLAILSNPNFSVMFLMIAILLVTYIAYTTFEKYNFYTIRLKNKREYVKKLILTVVGVNTILFVIAILFILMGLNIFNRFSLEGQYQFYQIPSSIYSLFFMLRLYILMMIFAIGNLCLVKIIHPSIPIIGNIFLFVLLFEYTGPNVMVIQNIIDTPLFIGGYLFNYQYGSFHLEIICTVIYCLALTFIMAILYEITVKKIKRIGE